MTLRPLALVLAVAALGACGEAPADAPTVVLAPGPDTLTSSYTNISQAAWLGGNRWAVLAPDDAVVGLVDLATGSVTPLGETQPGELQNPFTLFADEDTLYVGDWGLRRVSVWGPEGTLLTTIPAPDVLRGALPEARDAGNHYYADLFPPPGPDGSGNRDSAMVLRTAADFSAADTVVRLAPLDIAEVQSDAGRRFERRVFSGTDHWGVLRDGSVWVARVYHNRVDWYGADGSYTRGRPLPDRVLEVTRGDRELFVRQFPEELRSTAEQLPFAPIKPPFETAFSGGGGMVWLEKSRSLSDTVRRYHVVDREGDLMSEVHLPGRGRILAVGADTALVVVPSREGTRLVATPVPPAARGQGDEGAR